MLLRDVVSDSGLRAVREACRETFHIRAEQAWPPAIVLPPSWREPYAAVARALGLKEADLESAESALHDFLAAIEAA